MSTIARHHSPQISAELRRDLSMVLPALKTAESTEIKAYFQGTPVALDQAIARAVQLLHQSQAPAIIGLSGLTLEAIREAIALAWHMRAMLLPLPQRESAAVRLPVVQTSTLAHAMAADLRVAFREDATRHDSPIDQAITARVPNTLFVEGNDLDALLRLRARVREQGAAVFTNMTALPVTSVAVTLPANVDPRIEAQWHALAADAQQKIRISVISLPDLRTAGNQRGTIEVLTWQTGLSGTTGGVNFADGAPRPCQGAVALLQRGGVDVALDTGLHPLPADLSSNVKHRIRIGDELDGAADICLVTPGLSLGLRARVMRFDGVVLWLCDDPSPQSDAIDDPSVRLFPQFFSLKS